MVDRTLEALSIDTNANKPPALNDLTKNDSVKLLGSLKTTFSAI